MVANSVATEAAFVSYFIGPAGRKMMLNQATLPYYFATMMQAKLNKYIPGSKISANTASYPVMSNKAVYKNFLKGLIERIF